MKKLLTYSSDGRWRKQVEGTVFYFGRGKSKTDSRSYIAAEKKYFEFLAEREKTKGVVKRVSSLSMREFGEKFLQYNFSRYKRNEISASRFEKLRITVDGFVNYLGPKHALANLCEMDLEDYKTHVLSLPVSPCTKKPISIWTAKTRLDILKLLIKWGYKVALIDQLPRNLDGYSRVKLPAPIIKTFTNGEIKMLYKNANDRMKTWICLALNCAMGQSDIANLRVSEVNLSEGRIIRDRTKTGVHTQFALWDTTIEMLKKMGNLDGKPEDRVFLSQNGLPLVYEKYVGTKLTKTDAVRLAFCRLTTTTGLPNGRGFYTLRKSAATATEKINPAVTEMFLGHAERGLKRYYAHRDWDRLDSAVLELESRFDLGSIE